MLYMGSIEALLYIFYGILIALQCEKKKKKNCFTVFVASYFPSRGL